MGIFGLSAFVFEHGTLGTQCTWSSDSQQDENDHFIIDGNAFTYHYAMKTNFNWVHGGQYKMFAETVRRDIAAMQRAGIRLTFLFDGALPHDKEYTRMKRYRSYIERAELILAHLDQINNNLRTQESGIQHAADMYLIPPLMLEVCLQTIRDLGLDPVVCQGEADGRVVRLADECQGYVVSKDSDMHVYPHIGKGYIPLNTLTIYSEVSDNSHSHSNSTVKGTVYHPRRLASLLQLNSVALLPVFGAILGNDYIDPQLVRYPIMEWCSSRNMPVKNKISYWPKCVAEYLRDMGSDLDLVGIADNLKALIGKAREYNTAATAAAVDGLEEALVSSVYRYDPESTLLNGHTCSEDDYNDTLQQQGQVSEIFSEPGKLSRSIVDCLVTRTFWATIFIEDFQKESSWVISRTLRQCLYTLLLYSDDTSDSISGDNDDSDIKALEIKEYIREKHHMAEIVVPGLPLDQVLQQASTDSLQRILRDKRISTLLLHRMHCSDDEKLQPFLAELDNDNIRSFVLCLRYLINQNADQGSPLKNHEVVGLIVGAMASLACTDKWPEHSNTRPALKKQVLHLTAQYQSVVFCSHLLSQVLCTPQHLKSKAALEHMYDGLSMHQYLQLARRGANVGSLLGSSGAHELGGLFWKIHRATTTGLADKVEQVYDYRIPTSLHRQPTSNGAGSPDWLKPRNIKKRSNNSEASSGKNAKRLATAGSSGNRTKTSKKSFKSSSSSSSTTPSASPAKGGNIFDVLSFGCNFDED